MSVPGKITRIDSLFVELFKKKQWDKRLALHAVFRNWPQVVGQEIAERTEPQVIRGTVLWIAVSDSVWMQQLHLQKQTLLEHINANVRGGEKISDIRFQIDAALGEEKMVADIPQPAASPKPIDPEEQKGFEGLLGSIGDAELRTRLLALWRKAHR
ncbi:MAG: DciA family protein [Desulfurivibrionaceae bacterium]